VIRGLRSEDHLEMADAVEQHSPDRQ
jgi:hypothetical protein